MTGVPPASSLYLDTSCLLKLFFPEPETARVIELLAGEQHVVVSELARLEAETQLRARLYGGLQSRAKHRQLSAALTRTLALQPFAVIEIPVGSFDRARALGARAGAHCRTLDLLHVAVMDEHKLTRLLTNDSAQAAVATALGLSVTMPRGA